MAATVEVNIFGQKIKLTSDDNNAEQITELAARLEQRMQSIAATGKLLNPIRVSILAALQLESEGAHLTAWYKTDLAKTNQFWESKLKQETARQQKEKAELESSCQKQLAEAREKSAAELKSLQEKYQKLQKDYDELMQLLEEA